MTTAAPRRLTSREAIEDYGRQMYATLPPPSPQAAGRAAAILSAHLQRPETSSERDAPAA